MRKSRFTEEQIVAALKEHAAGAGTGELCRRLGISNETLYNWKRKYGGLSGSETRRLKALEEETRRLKKLLADQMLDNEALKDVLSKNWSGPPLCVRRLSICASGGSCPSVVPAGSSPPTAPASAANHGDTTMSPYDRGCVSWPKPGVASATGDCTCFFGGKGRQRTPNQPTVPTGE